VEQLKHILVVDDVPSNLKFAEQLLDGKFKLTFVISGAQALKYLQKNKPDLILLDINMPEMDGFETIKHIKEIPEADKIPIIFLTSECDNQTEIKCFNLGAVDYIRKPFVTEIMLSRINTQLELNSYRTELERLVEQKTAALQTKSMIIERLQDIMSTCFAELVESRDGTTGGHIKNTTRYFKIFIDELKKRPEYADYFTPDVIRNLLRAAPLHDIGKIGINDSVLRKESSLSQEEFEYMKSHTKIGGDTFQKIVEHMGCAHAELGGETFQKIYDQFDIKEDEQNTQFLLIAKDMALYHHERWNGTGYPTGISGETIPLYARILSIVDVYDALTSKRSYKEAFSHEKAMQIIKNDRESFFDPKLTDIFIEINDKIEECLKTKELV
jgi:putative two-component system response regulator